MSLACAATLACSPSAAADSYRWDSVAIGGGGVTAVVPSRSAPGVACARTDVGGAYRWDAASPRWSALLDWVSEDEAGLLGVEAIAPDQKDSARL